MITADVAVSGDFRREISRCLGSDGEDKIQAILDSGADVVTATDDSCLMHIEGIITRKKLPIRVLHYSRILAGEELLA